MSSEQPQSPESWEAQVSALIDGELDDREALALRSAVADDPALARAIIEAQQLQQLMRNIPLESAPAGLRRRLGRIPRQQQGMAWSAWLRPRWAFAVAAMPLLLALGLHWQDERQQQREIAQGQRDLVLALSYLQRAGEQLNPRISAALHTGITRPVADNALQALQQTSEYTKEYEL